MNEGAPGDGGGGGGVVGRGAMGSVATRGADVGTAAVAATERMCHTPSNGSVTVRSSSPAPLEGSSGEPGPWPAPVGLMATTSRAVGTGRLQVYVSVSLV